MTGLPGPMSLGKWGRGGGGDHITIHGTHIFRDMEPGGGPYISNDMGLPGPMSLGKWGRGGGGGEGEGGISLLHSSELLQVI